MNVQRLGSEYGGWNVDLDSIPQGSVVIDAGVGMDTSFAEALVAAKGVVVMLYDPGEAHERYALSRNIKGSRFFRAAIAKEDSVVTLYKHRTGGSDSLLPENRNSGDVTERVPAVSLKRIVELFKPAIVKLDIEGTEYDVYRDCLGVPQVAIEFHHRLIEGRDESDTNKVVEFFFENGYDVIHCGQAEVTFLRQEEKEWPRGT